MIISIKKGRSDVWPPWNSRIRLNGITINNVIYADDSKKLIERYVVDSEGKYILSKINDQTLTEIIHGDVQIIHGLADNE